MLLWLADQGLDLDDEEAMEYAADVVQADQEAFFAKERARDKGIKGFQNKGKGKASSSTGRAFDVSPGQLRSADASGMSTEAPEPQGQDNMLTLWTSWPLLEWRCQLPKTKSEEQGIQGVWKAQHQGQGKRRSQTPHCVLRRP